MKKLSAGMMALCFIAGMGFSVASLADKHDKKMDEAIAKACKGKKAGDAVKVDGKDMKCPEHKKEEKKH